MVHRDLIRCLSGIQEFSHRSKNISQNTNGCSYINLLLPACMAQVWTWCLSCMPARQHWNDHSNQRNNCHFLSNFHVFYNYLLSRHFSIKAMNEMNETSIALIQIFTGYWAFSSPESSHNQCMTCEVNKIRAHLNLCYKLER